MPTVSTDLREFAPTDTLTVFVHGYLATGGVLRPLGEYLASNGIASRQLHFTFAPTGSIADQARKLDVLIDRARRSATDKLHIVGHSLGGLVGRYYRQVLGHPLERLVCIATPHGGVPRATAFRALPMVDELSPGSSTLALLEATKRRLAGTQVTCIDAAEDNLVPLAPWTHIEGAVQRRIRGVGHLGVLFEREAWDHVADALRSASTGR
jgi:triacylglycerol lipase